MEAYKAAAERRYRVAEQGFYYQEMQQEIWRLARYLKKMDVKREETVLVILPSSRQQFCFIQAIWLCAAIPVIISPLEITRLPDILQETKASVIGIEHQNYQQYLRAVSIFPSTEGVFFGEKDYKERRTLRLQSEWIIRTKEHRIHLYHRGGQHVYREIRKLGEYTSFFVDHSPQVMIYSLERKQETVLLSSWLQQNTEQQPIGIQAFHRFCWQFYEGIKPRTFL